LAARLDRFVACYWIATALGWDDAWRIRYAALRELLPLFGRNAATEEYCLRPSLAAATRALWARMVAEKLPAAAVHEEVQKIRPAQVVRMHGQAGRFAVVKRELLKLRGRDDLLAVIRLAQERLERLGMAADVA
jgi:hypothetical protein